MVCSLAIVPAPTASKHSEARAISLGIVALSLADIGVGEPRGALAVGELVDSGGRRRGWAVLSAFHTVEAFWCIAW